MKLWIYTIAAGTQYEVWLDDPDDVMQVMLTTDEAASKDATDIFMVRLGLAIKTLKARR